METKFKINLSFFWTKDSSIWHLAFGIFLICLLICFSFKISDEFYWSGWSSGDAQIMLSLRQWEEEGWLANKFLFIPQGYAKVIRILDEPRLRHHAHGISPAVSPKVGPRLWYAHYPSGYLIPYATLFRLGLHDIFFMRLLSVIFSLGAVLFMYILFSKIITPAVSFVATFFYAITPTFLYYAHSLANQPIDDFLRFAFMVSVVFSTRAISLRQRKIWMVSAWSTQFLLSLCSFDSVFFVYFWLIGWYILEYRRFRWKIYFIYALAPLTAYFLQFFQNVWYLGLSDAISDAKDAFFVRGMADTDRFISMYYLFATIFNEPYKRLTLVLILSLFILYIVYTKFLLKGRKDSELPSLKLLIVLFSCGLPFFLILPSAATMTYQIKQMLPFIALLESGSIWVFLREIKPRLFSKFNWFEEEKILFRKKTVLLCFLLSLIFLTCFAYISKFSIKNDRFVILPNSPEMILAKEIKSMGTKYEPVIFNLGGFQSYINANYVPGYPQINPLIEYHAGSKLILCFDAPETLASDLLYLMYRVPYQFSPILVSRNKEDTEKVFLILSKSSVLKEVPTQSFIMNKNIIDLTDYLEWDYVRSKGED